MTNGLSVGRQRIRSLMTRGMMVPLKFTLGTSAAIVKAVPLLLVDLLNEDGVTGRAYTFCYRPSGAVAISSHLFEAVDLLKGKCVTPFDVTQTVCSAWGDWLRPDGALPDGYGDVGRDGTDAGRSAFLATRIPPEAAFSL